MAKLKAQKRRRIRLRRVAVVLLVVLALLVAAVGIIVLHVRSIVLAALRVQFPHCEVSVGRASLNPLRKLTLYDVEIVDRARPKAPSTIRVDRVVASFALRAGLKFDIDLDVSRPRVELSNVTGKTPPFPDLFEREPSEKPSRFRLRQTRLRECRIKIADPAFTLDTSFELAARGLDGQNSQLNLRGCQVKFANPGLRLETSLEVGATGLSLAGSGGPASGQPPASITFVMGDLVLTVESAAVVQNADGAAAPSKEKGKTTFEMNRLEGKLGYDAAEVKMLDRLLLHEVRVSGGEVAVKYPDNDHPEFRLGGKLDLSLKNASGDVYNFPTSLAIDSDDFQLEAGLLMTEKLDVVIAADVHVRSDASALTASGTLAAQGLSGTLTGRLDKTGLHVTTLFEQQGADQLVDLFEREQPHKIPVIHDFDGLSGTVERFELALAYTPELGFGLTGAITANQLKGESPNMMLVVDGIAVDTTFSLLPPERGAALEFVVGDPDAEAGPGRIVGKEVTWEAPGDMAFLVTGVMGLLSMEDSVWTLGDILGAVFDGRGTGTVQALADGTVTLDLRFDGVNMAPLFAEVTGKEQDQMTGHADATLAITLKDTGDGLGLYSVKGSLKTKPPGGVLKLKEKEKSFGSVPGGDKVLGAVKQQMSPRFYDHFLEKFKNYQYESITIEASTEGDDYVLVVKIRDADKKNPLPVDLSIRYSRVHVYHDGSPPQ